MNHEVDLWLPLALVTLMATTGVAAVPVPTDAVDVPDTHDAQTRARSLLDGLRSVQETRALMAAHDYLYGMAGANGPAVLTAAAEPEPWRDHPTVDQHRLTQVPAATLSFLDALFALRSTAANASGDALDMEHLAAVRATIIGLVPRAPSAPLQTASGPLLDVCGVAFVHLGSTPVELTCEYPVLVGGFGDDTYRNRAGGNTPDGAAIAIDLGGDDRYLGQIHDDGGVNGGALRGFGALVDLAGHDVYDGRMLEHPLGYQSHGGANGGARHGVSLLVDVAGTDHYHGTVGLGGVNGGAGFGADAMLIDLDGTGDTFDGSVRGFSGGINGGSNDGVGRFLHCGRGGSTYNGTTTERGGVNAGVEQGVAVFASCGGGGDLYTGTTGGGGVNGAVSGDGVAVFVHLEGDAVFSGHGRYGGVNAGSYIGSAFMVSGGGNQTYDGSLKDVGGINGGAVIGSAVLIDLGGNDTYIARMPGTGGANGGGVGAGVGMLVDVSGEDVYDAWVGGAPPTDHTGPFAGAGVNGAGGFAGCGLLLDLGGTDRYRAHPDDAFSTGSEWDVRTGCGTTA